MPEEPEVFIFEIDLDGVVRTAEEPREDFSEDFSLEVKESYLSLWLNHRADDIASDIEREVRRVLRPFVVGSVAVQAEVSFKPGDSLIIAGTVMAVVGALGTVAGQAASQALGQNLARLLEIPINRLLRRWMSQGNEATGPGPLQFEPFSVNVTPAPVTQTRQQATVLPGSQESSAPPTQ